MRLLVRNEGNTRWKKDGPARVAIFDERGAICSEAMLLIPEVDFEQTYGLPRGYATTWVANIHLPDTVGRLALTGRLLGDGVLANRELKIEIDVVDAS